MAKDSPAGLFGWGDQPVINIDDERWRQIEHAYGSSFPQSVRASIVRATESFSFLHTFERTPERMAKVKVVLEAHDKAASRFFNELFTGPSVTSDAGSYAHYLIENNFRSSQTTVIERGLDGLLDVLRAFHIACNASIKELNDRSSTNVLAGDAWKIWINRLAEILFEARLPVSVRNDDGSKGKQLPLLPLVRELQACLPREYRHDEAALAEGISQALVVEK